MTKEQLKALCDRLRANDQSLTSLCLDYGNLGVDGAILLAEALHENRVVNYVEIHQSKLGFKGAEAILKALKGRGIKTQLHMCDDFTEEEYNTLLAMTPGRKNTGKKAGKTSKTTSRPQAKGKERSKS